MTDTPEGNPVDGLQRTALEILVDRAERGDPLTGLRCGRRVCEQLLALAADGYLDVTAVEQDGDTWLLDVELA